MLPLTLCSVFGIGFFELLFLAGGGDCFLTLAAVAAVVLIIQSNKDRRRDN